MALTKVNEIVSSYPVVVFSYCRRVKQLLTQVGASYKDIELEERDGDEIQSALARWTGQGTVPNVFIGRKHVGGCNTLMEKSQQGELVPLLVNAGAIANNSVQLRKS